MQNSKKGRERPSIFVKNLGHHAHANLTRDLDSAEK
jgi:hypothetical protein